MAKVNVSLPQGTRDFGADVVRKRNYIFNTIKTVFELYGFAPAHRGLVSILCH